MTPRSAPAETDRFRFDLDVIQFGGAGLGGPTLRQMLIAACVHGDDEALHDDPERAQEFADTLERYRERLEAGRYLELDGAEARLLYEASMSAWSYADQNNYGNDDEEDEQARLFGQYGGQMLHMVNWPWTALTFSDDGNHGFTRV